jgi:hypothetical protein
VTSFREYVEHGWKLCSIQPGTKGPKTDGWQKEERAVTNVMAAAGLPGAGLCHAWSGTCALDVDEIDLASEFLKQRGVDLYELLNARDAVQIFSGKEGRAKLLYRLPEPLASLKLAPYKAPGKTNPNKEETYHAFELRCANKGGLTVQDVLPPTIHPETGNPYRWVYGDRLLGHWSRLPEIPEALHKLWVDTLNAGSSGASTPQAPTGILPEEIERLLAGKDPSDYDQWIDVGQRLHHEYRASPDGLAVWVHWSQRSSKFKGYSDCETHWRSFRYDVAGVRTMGGLRAEMVSRPEDFAIIEAPQDDQDDTRIDPMMQRLVGQHLVYVRELDRYFDTRSRSVFISDRAVRNAFLPDIPYTMSGDTPKKQDPITWLMGSSERRGRDVQAVGMHPGEGVTFEDGGRRYANCHPPRKPIESLPPSMFEIECFQFIWSRMLDTRYQQWLMKFYAYALQHPGDKIQVAPILVSEMTGSGKSTIMEAIPRLLYGEILPYSEAQLKAQFNGELLSSWWVTFQEIYAGSTKSERRQITDKIKPWITDPKIPVVPKGLQAIQIPNRLQFTGSSNHMDALQLDDAEERRWGVCAVREERYTPRERLDVYQGFLNTPRAPGVLKHIFENVNLTGFYPTAEAPVTNAKRTMVEMGRGEWEARIQERWEAGEAPFDRDVFSIRELRSQVFGSGGPTPVMLGQMIGKAPFNFKQLPNCGSRRLYAHKNFEQWSKLTNAARLNYIQTGTRPPHVNWDFELPPEFAACPLL